MKTKYYEYNKQGGEKYSEFTEKEFLVAKEDETRWFISFGNCVLECEEDEYRSYYSEKNHADYIQKDKSGKRVILLYIEDCACSEKRHIDNMVIPIEEAVIEKISAEEMNYKLCTALESLSSYEKDIIKKLFLESKSQTQLAKEYGVKQQTMHEKLNRILLKLLKIIKSEK